MTFIKHSKYIAPIKHASYKYSKLRIASIAKMHNNIKEDPLYFGDGYKNMKLMVKKYISKHRLDVQPRFSKLIALISKYFNVYSVWVIKVIPGTIEPIKTVWSFGYKEEVMLAAKYIANEINNLEQFRLSRQEYYRAVKSRGRRRGRRGNIVHKTDDARTKAIRYMERQLEKVVEAWEKILADKPLNPYSDEKYKNIGEFLKKHVELDYAKLNYKNKLPGIKNAHCRKGHFKKNTVIIG